MNYLKVLVLICCIYESACFEDDIPRLPTELTKKEAEALLKAHNDYRREVVPTGSNIRLLTWSSDLADQAQFFVSKCVFRHGEPYSFGEFGNIGENLFMSTGNLKTPADISQAVTSWYNEKTDYDFTANKCAAGKTCGHYTQVVWDNTYKIGCGISRCQGTVVVGGTNYAQPTMIACRYGPSGNVKLLFTSTPRRPYKSGPRCSACSAETPDCVSNLCYSKPEKIVTGNETYSQPMSISTAPATRTTKTTSSSATTQTLRCNYCQGAVSNAACLEMNEVQICGDTSLGKTDSQRSSTDFWVCATYWENNMVKKGCIFDSRCLDITGQGGTEAECCTTDVCNRGGGTPVALASLALVIACVMVSFQFSNPPYIALRE